MYYSMNFDDHIHSGNNYPMKIQKFCNSSESSLCLLVVTHPHPQSEPLADTDLLSVFLVLSFPDCHINAIIKYVVLEFVFFHVQLFLGNSFMFLLSVLQSFLLLRSIPFYGFTTDYSFTSHWTSSCFQFGVQERKNLFLLFEVLPATLRIKLTWNRLIGVKKQNNTKQFNYIHIEAK